MEAPFRAGQPTPMPRSLWAAVTPGALAYPQLEGSHTADVVVVGGGFMGLTAALALVERGVDVALLEAAEIGWGASGRNNGLIAPGLKRDPSEVRQLLDAEVAEKLLRFSGDAPSLVFDLIARNEIDCDVNRSGWIQAAHAKRALPLIEQRVREWRELGAEADMIRAGELEHRLGSPYFAGAWFDPRGGSLNPLAYVRGLARTALDAGVRVFERSPALGIETSGTTRRVSSNNGEIRCEQVICCTNAYGLTLKPLKGKVVPLRTAQVATMPLPENVSKSIVPCREAVSDTQRLLTSFRMTADNRLIMGGASATAGNESQALFRHLHRAAEKRFPDKGGFPWQFGWSGYLALTPDHLPHIYKCGDGMYAGIGCNGRGIAMATAIGISIADLICGGDEKDCNVPVTAPRRIPGYALRYPGVAVSVVFNRLLDRAERWLG